MSLIQHISDKSKHAIDMAAVALGGTATVSHWITEIINPILTSMISIATLVWLYYRVQEIRSKIKNKKEIED